MCKDPSQNTNLGKCQVEKIISGKTFPVEETIDLSQFTLVATTSTTNPQLPKKLLLLTYPLRIKALTNVGGGWNIMRSKNKTAASLLLSELDFWRISSIISSSSITTSSVSMVSSK